MLLTIDRQTFINSFHPITNEEFEAIESKLQTSSFKKGEHIITPGQIQRHLYFVQKGCKDACDCFYLSAQSLRPTGIIFAAKAIQVLLHIHN